MLVTSWDGDALRYYPSPGTWELNSEVFVPLQYGSIFLQHAPLKAALEPQQNSAEMSRTSGKGIARQQEVELAPAGGNGVSAMCAQVRKEREGKIIFTSTFAPDTKTEVSKVAARVAQAWKEISGTGKDSAASAALQHRSTRNGSAKAAGSSSQKKLVQRAALQLQGSSGTQPEQSSATGGATTGMIIPSQQPSQSSNLTDGQAHALVLEACQGKGAKWLVMQFFPDSGEHVARVLEVVDDLVYVLGTEDGTTSTLPFSTILAKRCLVKRNLDEKFANWMPAKRLLKEQREHKLTFPGRMLGGGVLEISRDSHGKFWDLVHQQSLFEVRGFFTQVKTTNGAPVGGNSDSKGQLLLLAARPVSTLHNWGESGLQNNGGGSSSATEADATVDDKRRSKGQLTREHFNAFSCSPRAFSSVDAAAVGHGEAAQVANISAVEIPLPEDERGDVRPALFSQPALIAVEPLPASSQDRAGPFLAAPTAATGLTQITSQDSVFLATGSQGSQVVIPERLPGAGPSLGSSRTPRNEDKNQHPTWAFPASRLARHLENFFEKNQKRLTKSRFSTEHNPAYSFSIGVVPDHCRGAALSKISKTLDGTGLVTTITTFFRRNFSLETVKEGQLLSDCRVFNNPPNFSTTQVDETLIEKRQALESCQFLYSSVSVNRNVVTPVHRDKNNCGRSAVFSVGKYTGGATWIFDLQADDAFRRGGAAVVGSLSGSCSSGSSSSSSSSSAGSSARFPSPPGSTKQEHGFLTVAGQQERYFVATAVNAASAQVHDYPDGALVALRITDPKEQKQICLFRKWRAQAEEGNSSSSSAGEMHMQDLHGGNETDTAGLASEVSNQNLFLGRVYNCKQEFVLFDGRIPHCTMPFSGNRITLVYYYHKSVERLRKRKNGQGEQGQSELLEKLDLVGFQVPPHDIYESSRRILPLRETSQNVIDLVSDSEEGEAGEGGIVSENDFISSSEETESEEDDLPVVKSSGSSWEPAAKRLRGQEEQDVIKNGAGRGQEQHRSGLLNGRERRGTEATGLKKRSWQEERDAAELLD
ncbi:unnamed protein product [Amoebophrya sp. A120]|nr:unnamed protein product [Amoebophrya sp. A120]|eukprot:GSA120T00018677001.1